MMTKTVFILAGALAALPVMAETITFTISATGSGTFDDVSFSNKTITFTQVTDTADIMDTTIACSFGYPCSPGAINTVSVGGEGATFTNETYFFDNLENLVGITNEGGVAYLAAEASPPFNTYGLTTALASSYPLYASSGLLDVETNGGDLTATFSGPVTFSAVLGSSAGPSPVPEPGSLGLALVAGIPLTVGLLRRRKRARSAAVPV